MSSPHNCRTFSSCAYLHPSIKVLGQPVLINVIDVPLLTTASPGRRLGEVGPNAGNVKYPDTAQFEFIGWFPCHG